MKKTLILTACTTPVSQEDIILPALQTPTPTYTLPKTNVEPDVAPATRFNPNASYIILSKYCADSLSYQLSLSNLSGGGTKEIELPGDGRAYNIGSVSPDGKWVAYNVGSLESPHDLSLHIMHIISGETREISNIFSEDYPENQIEIAKLMPLGIVSGYDAPEDWLPAVENSFRIVESAFAWSPDSQKLVFAAQREGFSLDTYLYDISSGVLEQVFESDFNTRDVSWSPTGRYIINVDQSPVVASSVSRTLSIVDLENGEIYNSQNSSKPWQGEGWISEHEYLIYETEDREVYDYKILNLKSGSTETISQLSWTVFPHIDLERKLFAMTDATLEPNTWTVTHLNSGWKLIEYNRHGVSFLGFLDSTLKIGRAHV